MANVKISELPAASAAAAANEFEINEAGTSKKVTGTQVAAFVEGVVSSAPSFTGQVSLADGSAAAPSLSNTGDLNTGLLFPAADTVGVSVGGTQRLTVGTSGVTVNGDFATTTSGTSNFVAGVNAGNSIESGGNYNVVVGDEAGTAITTGDNNVAVGTNAADALTTGVRNVAIGFDALTTAVDDDQNTAVGAYALNTTEADNNTGVGYLALYANTTGARNVAVGAQALDANTSASQNTAVGYSSLSANTTGAYNTALGDESLGSCTTGANNTAVGNDALYSTTTGNDNTAVGYAAGLAVTTGTNNTFIGGLAGDAITTSSSNVAVGDYALSAETSSNGNVAIGSGALKVQNAGGSGDARNVAVGLLAGVAVTTGTNNVLIGYSAGSSSSVDLTTGSNNIVIGGNRPSLPAGELHSILIGTVANIGGKGNNTGFISPNSGAVYQGNNSSAWSTVSDRRLKKNIVDSTIGLAEINQLQVRNFEYLTANEITELPTASAVDRVGVQLGVIAQEIQAILPKCVKEESTGVLSVDPDNLTWHMIKAIQELSAKNDALEARLTTLEG